ncbi:WD40 repeat-like protein [Pilatotrama ljubarskyi]|nr:WD40 repeat-like protein [Pilatotrama ljubarskyi]
MEVEDPNAPVYVPWYRKSNDVQPYVLSTVLNSDNKHLKCTACFPWTADSFDTLWDGHAAQEPQLVSQWRNVSKKWVGAIAVGGTGQLFVFPKLASVKPFSVTLSEPDVQIDNVAWVINSNRPLEPLIVFTITSVILILDVNSRSLVGKLRGHGGPITSLSVHPTQPNLFCTTSRDFTTRIYDLTLYPVQIPNNPHWLPRREPSLAGPAHGLHMCEPEGEGIGQCVAVMVGGRSGGHKGAVLCAAFHPSHPLIATGGIDRAVKIWRIPPAVFSPPAQPRLAREDKPLFSTDLLHKARVESVSWLADDILVSHSAPALMRRDQENIEDTYYEEGTVAVWQWLSLNRFFPPGKIPQKIMRGTASVSFCASSHILRTNVVQDYRNSESFKILSAYHLPMVIRHLHTYRSIHHDPILLIPLGKTIRVFNIAQFGPRTPPRFPGDDLVYLTDQMQLGVDTQRQADEGSRSGQGRRGTSRHTQDGGLNSGEEGDGDANSDPQRKSAPTVVYPPPAPLAVLLDAVDGWDVEAKPPNDFPAEISDVSSCEVGYEGGVIVGVGGGTLFVWRLQE